jgi:hypothetical protein
MNTLTDLSNPPSRDTAADAAPFFIRGKLVEGADQTHRSRDLGVDFVTPKIDLNALVHPRTELPPLLNVKTSEIIDFLVEAGQKLTDGKNPYMDACIERMAKVSLQPRKSVENTMRHSTSGLNKAKLMEELEQNFPNPKALDEWVPHTDHLGRRSFIRAYAPDPRPAGQLAGDGHQVDRAVGAGQVGQPVQDGLGRSVLDRRLPAHHGRR